MTDTGTQRLKLIVQDEEDLAVVSAHLQDMVVRVGDMAFFPRDRRFALAGCRFDWMAAETGRVERCHTGLHFDHVLGASLQGIDRGQPDVMLNLLSIVFLPGNAPSGGVVLTFSGGGAVRLDVECLDAQMRDFGARWPTKRQPGHAQDREGQTMESQTVEG